ncbi:MAG TPA: phosphohistidine phosphatase SixA [Terriglobia bacterium]|nr:phosphohistidine phosphatase SixA [Terriglobia bacterium]
MSRDPSVGEEVRTGHELYFMRHAAALAGDGSVFDDAKRPLTPDGKAKLKQIAGGLRRLGFPVDWIVTSPLVRAVETAEIVAESVGDVPVDFCDALRPGGAAEALVAFLAKQPVRKRILLVGHEPGLSELAARLLGAGRHAGLSFKKGGCCLITFSEFPPKSPGRLVWWLTPRVMRKLAN